RIAARAANDFYRLIITIKNLDPAITKLANVLSPLGIDANIVRIAQLPLAAASFAVTAQKMTLIGKHLDSMITRIGDEYLIFAVDKQTFGPIKLAGAGTRVAKAAQELLTARGEPLYALHQAVFADVNVMTRIGGHRPRKEQLSRVCPMFTPLRE